MPLADWLIAKPSLAAEAQLQHSVCVLRANGATEIEATVRLAEDLMRQNMHYKTLLNQAIAHISTLELAAFLREADAPPQPSPALLPPPRRACEPCAREGAGSSHPESA